jgi:dynamin-binding protein
MEAGINADQNFYRRQFPQSSEDSQVRSNYDDQQRDFEPRPPQPPPKISLITNNLQAAATNGYGAVAVNTPTADDFYRNYRENPPSQGYNNSSTNGMLTATQPGTASRQPPSSFRSNSNGTTPKHPTISASRNPLKPSYRSASAPLDERMVLSTAKSTSALKGPQQPSVKDLLKRFDQNNEQTTSASRRPLVRTPLNENGSGGPGYLKSRSTVENRSPIPASRAGMMTRDTALARAKSPTTVKTTQRSKFASEDQHSNNTLSSVARTPRSRHDVSGNAQASQSMTNLAPTPPAKPPSPIFTRKPLFGEVVPEESGLKYPGFGIADTRVRRTSDGNLSQPSWRQRSQSDADVAPPSPTAWYRGATAGLLDELDTNKTPRKSRQHNRSQSDFAVEKGYSAGARYQENRDRYKSPPPITKPSPQSRLPLSSKRLSTPSESASPTSTRSTSPSRFKTTAPSTNTSKGDSRPWSPAGRSTTPSDRSKTPAGRSTTPTSKSIPSHRSPGRQIASPPKIPMNNSSLKAYISAPPPKTSPPLRSSRPRLPVSSATTASSRGKMADRSETPQQHQSSRTLRSGGNEGKTASRSRVPGPADFAAYRETIQRNVSISIKEGEEKKLKEARLRRLAAERAVNTGAKPATEINESTPETPLTLPTPVQIVIEEAQSPKLELQTSFSPSNNTYIASRQQPETSNLDSPTLGIPGSYPNIDPQSDEDDPHSAISNATGFTEIDMEPQTEPASQSQGISFSDTLGDKALTDKLDYKPSVDTSIPSPNENISIPIILDTTSVDETEATTQDNNFYGNQNRYGDEPIEEQHGYHAPVFTTTSPMEMPEDQILPSTLGNAEKPTFEQDNSLPNGIPTIIQRLKHVELQESHAPDPPKKFPLWDSEQQAPSPFSLPALETTGIKSTFQAELVQTPITEIDSASSDDIGETSNSFEEHYDGTYNQTPQYGVSQQFGWADTTVNTIDQPVWRGDHSHLPPIPLFESLEEPPKPPPKEEYTKPEVPPKPFNYSPLPSPRSTANTPRIASPSRTFKSDYSYNTERRSSEPSRSSVQDIPAIPSVPPWPDHSPPPPPQGAFVEMVSLDSARSPPLSNSYNRRPASSVYRSTRDPDSRRQSNDDLNSSRLSTSTPISSTRISLNEDMASSRQFDEPPKAIPLDPEEREAAEKLAKRLQHRGRVIKELIDTESVYLKDMNVVEEIYKGTAEACPKLEPGDIKTIFRNTDQIVAFSTMFLDELKAASASVYSPRHQKSRQSRNFAISPTEEKLFINGAYTEESDLEKDHKTRVGEYFGRHLKEMQTVYTDFLKSSELASTRLATLQSESAVKVWLNECNHVAKDLTAAWDLDALLIKPVQRITRYQLLLKQLLELTPDDHPDHQALHSTLGEVGGLLKSIDDLKKRIDTVNKIVGRKRKESDVRSGIAKAFGRSREKSLASSSNRFADDEVYLKLHEKFGDDYLRLQVVLRDVEFYTRQANTYVNDFLRLLSSMELEMRVSPSPYPELESKWARFNMSMRDMGTVALEDHVSFLCQLAISG